MQRLIRRGCLLMIVALAGCQADVDDALESSPASALSTRQRQAPTTGVTGSAPTVTVKGTTIHRSAQLRNAVVGRRNADGTVTTACFDDAESAAAFLHDPSVPATTQVAQ